MKRHQEIRYVTAMNEVDLQEKINGLIINYHNDCYELTDTKYFGINGIDPIYPTAFLTFKLIGS